MNVMMKAIVIAIVQISILQSNYLLIKLQENDNPESSHIWTESRIKSPTGKLYKN